MSWAPQSTCSESERWGKCAGARDGRSAAVAPTCFLLPQVGRAGKACFGRRICLLCILLAAGAIAACDSFQSRVEKTDAGPHLRPVLARMKDVYSDLASGRFISLADFESPGQETLFRCIGPDGSEGQRPQPTLSILRSRKETGAGGLKVRLTAPDDELVLDGKRSKQYVLVRDWREYSLLLVSIYGPPTGLKLEMAITSGRSVPLRWHRTIQVHPGWNLCRFDLESVGDWIDLSDVQALSWRAPDLTGPVDLYLDDLIIADNAQYQLGRQAGPGELYVLTRGRRIVVGARQRFELAFADGQIVSWRGEGAENLADISGLGPWPVPLAEDWADSQTSPVAYDDPQLFSGWGNAVATSQRVVEATPFRVVLMVNWRFADPPQPLPAEGDLGPGPGHSWQYVIYPWGAVYVKVSSRAPGSGWAHPRLGYAIGLDGRRDFQHPEGTGRDDFILMARPGGQRADLLWTWASPTRFNRQRVLTSADQRRLAALAGDLEAAQTVDLAHLLRIWPADIDSTLEAVALAADYRNPAKLKLTAGRLIMDARGDLDHDGYNESEGCYELACEGGVVRFELDPGPHLRFDPVFRVQATADRQCWVYARGRLLKEVGRDADDNLLFHLARLAGTPVAVEVHVSGEGPTPAAGRLAGSLD